MNGEHISIEELFSFIDGTSYKKRETEIKRHINECDKCKTELDQYRVMNTMLNQNRLYEPENSFLPMVTSNLPNIYNKKVIPFVEIISSLLIAIPFCLSFMFIAYDKMDDLKSILITLIHTVYEISTSFRIINDNIEIFALFGIYLLFFMFFEGIIGFIMIKKKALYIDR